jgi:hypothetical protein
MTKLLILVTGNVSGVCPECGEGVDRRLKTEGVEKR